MTLTLGASFSARAAERGAQLAVCGRFDSVSYEELDSWSGRVARGIVEEIGLVPQPCILLGRMDCAGVAGMLAAAKTPHSLIALDEEIPVAAASAAIREVGAALCLYAASASPLATSLRLREGLPVLSIDDKRWRSDLEPLTMNFAPSTVSTLSLTSGTSGARKCVEISHEIELRRAAIIAQAKPISVGDVCGQASLISTISARSTTLRYLLSGATLLPFDLRQESLSALAERLTRSGMTHISATPTAYRLLASGLPERGVFPELRTVQLSGETIKSSDADLVFRTTPRDSVLQTFYGSTEIGYGANATYLRDDKTARFGAMTVFDDIEIDLVDAAGQRVTNGSGGRIRVASNIVALGYRGDGAKGAERRFVSLADGRRAFLSDDLGGFDERNRLIFHKRDGSEVKLNGERVDPLLVEEWFLDQPEIRHAAVVAQFNDDDEKRQLTAFVVVDAANADPIEALRRRAEHDLPRSLRPAAIVSRECLPHSPSAKIDRKQLEMDVEHLGLGAPNHELDSRYGDLADLWHQILGRPPAGEGSNFFDLGGDSIAAAHLALAIEARLGASVDMQFAYAFPELGQQKSEIERWRSASPGGSGQDRLVTYLPTRNLPDAADDSSDAMASSPFHFISGAGGHVFPFAPIAQLLVPHGWQGHGILHPRFRLEEPAVGSVEELATRMLKAIRTVQPEPPYMLLGYSLGGLVAHEIGARLSDAGQVARVVLIDVESSNLQPFRSRAARNLRELRNRIRSNFDGATTEAYGGQLKTLIDNEVDGRAQNRLSNQVFGAPGAMARRYVPRSSSAPTALLRVADRPDDVALPDYGWSKVLSRLDVRLVAGNHLSLFKGEHEASFSQELANAMAMLKAGD